MPYGNEYLDAILPSGISRGQNQSIARNLGYRGEFGSGGHQAWLNEDPSRMTAWNRAVGDAGTGGGFGSDAWMQQEIRPGYTRGMNQKIAADMGYRGGFGAGEHNQWLGADPNRGQAFKQYQAMPMSGLAPLMGGQRGMERAGMFGGGFGGMGGGYGMSGFAPLGGMSWPAGASPWSQRMQQQNMFG